MRIYDFDTFLKQRKSIKAIKFKKVEEMQDYYDKVYSYLFGKKLKAIYGSDFFGFIFVKIYFDETEILYLVSFNTFNDYIEYIEINDELEIE